MSEPGLRAEPLGSPNRSFEKSTADVILASPPGRPDPRQALWVENRIFWPAMPPPNITADELRALIPCLEELSAARPPSGQKLVFPCRIAGREFVLKVVACGAMDETASTEMSQPNDVFLRA